MDQVVKENTFQTYNFLLRLVKKYQNYSISGIKNEPHYEVIYTHEGKRNFRPANWALLPSSSSIRNS